MSSHSATPGTFFRLFHRASFQRQNEEKVVKLRKRKKIPISFSGILLLCVNCSHYLLTSFSPSLSLPPFSSRSLAHQSSILISPSAGISADEFPAACAVHSGSHSSPGASDNPHPTPGYPDQSGEALYVRCHSSKYSISTNCSSSYPLLSF